MLERRVSHRPPAPGDHTEDVGTADAIEPVTVEVPALEVVEPHPAEPGLSPALVAYARRLANDHHTTHHRPITGEQLRARMGVSADLATDLLTQIRKEPVS
ncbi:hypothetical protein ABZ297_13460 [Nonomuraea sp. NPDC005983]|uniref:hypothetical protein n=1 Tax=Nonomuraea sp. NPDC005983 TaxID=3155595 RepID=UPI0033B6D4D8